MSMTQEERDAFLEMVRLGMLTTLRADGSPVTVPVWFEWAGGVVRVFSEATAGKLRRIERDPRMSLVATNAVGELEAWVAFEGQASVTAEGAIELAERLAHRYWDMTNPAYTKVVAGWRKAAEHLRVIELRPRHIRTSKG